MVNRTISRIHFEDLSSARFEDLCLSLIYREKNWIEIYHFGRTGSDDGIDIFGKQELENGKHRSWFVQCKRYQKINKSELKKAVDEAIKKAPKLPDIFMMMVSCDVTKKNID